MKYCHQYPNRARICDYCNTIFYYNCLKQQPNHQTFNRDPCDCSLDSCSQLDPVAEYLANKLYTKCRICCEFMSILKIKKHEAKCQQQEQESMNCLQTHQKFELLSVHSQNFQRCSTHTGNSKRVCQKCLLVQIDPKQQVGEEQIGKWLNLQFQCTICKKKGQYFEISNSQIVDVAGLEEDLNSLSMYKLFLFKFKKCVIHELEKFQEQVIQVNNLKTIQKIWIINFKEEYEKYYDKLFENFDIVNGYVSNTHTRSITYDSD